jgi:uncharacterized protein YndB with AHSA1/START domain
MTAYFVHDASASMTEGAAITWSFGIYGKGEIRVKSLVKNKQIVLEWGQKRTEFHIEPEDGGASSIVKITETGWEDFTPESVADALDRTEGWTDMLLSMKAYLMYGVDLRDPARVTEPV